MAAKVGKGKKSGVKNESGEVVQACVGNGSCAGTGKVKPVSMKVADLKEYEMNARNITEQAVDYVAWSVREFGYNEPIVVDEDGVIVCGHVRKRALQKLGVEEVTVLVAEGLTKEQSDAFRLADNKIAAMAIWDKEKLQRKFAFLQGSFDIEKLGFDTAMFNMPETVGESLFGTVVPDGEDGDGSGHGSGCTVKNTSGELDLDDFADDKFKHVCPHCGLKFN